MKISHESMKLSREFIICSSQWPFSGVQFSDLHLGYHKVTWKKLVDFVVFHARNVPWRISAPNKWCPRKRRTWKAHRSTGTVGGQRYVVIRLLAAFSGRFSVKAWWIMISWWIKLSWKMMEMMEHHSDECVSNLFLLQEWIPGHGNDHISFDPRQNLLSRWFFEAFSLLVGYLSSFPGG